MCKARLPRIEAHPPGQPASRAVRAGAAQGRLAASVRHAPADIQWKKSRHVRVEVGTVLTVVFTVAKLLGFQSQARLTYLIALDVWLFLTVLFANFATALAEARGKAQADALRKTRRETPAYRLHNHDDIEETVSTTCKPATGLWSRRAR